MRGEVATQQLGDGYYLHSYNIETFYRTETIVSPVALPALDQPKASQLFETLGDYEPYRLSQYMQARDVLVDRGHLVELARVEDGRVVVNPEALQIFQRYEENDISFVGNYGRVGSGKSFWYDKILNLSHIDGHGYEANPSRQGIYFWSLPFSKGRLKFFLLDFVGFEGRDTLTPDDQKLLDLQLLLAEKLVVVPEPQDQQLSILPIAYGHLLASQGRFSDQGVPANKFSPYWPNQIYTLYRSGKPIRRQIDNIGALFEVYNFSIMHDALRPGTGAAKDQLSKSTVIDPQAGAPLNEKYVRMTSVVFQDIYQKMKGKHYHGQTFNGHNLPRILQQATHSLNHAQGLPVDQIFQGVTQNYSHELQQRAKTLYLQQLQPLTQDPSPKPMDDLITAFERGNGAAFELIDGAELPRRERERVEAELRRQVQQIEGDILEDNKRKTYLHYSQVLPSTTNSDAAQAYQEVATSFRRDKARNRLDHNDTLPVARRLRYPVSTTNQPTEQLLKQRILERQQELALIEQHSSNPEVRGLRPATVKMAQTRDLLESKAITLKQALDDEQELLRLSPQQKRSKLEALREQHARNEEWKAKAPDSLSKGEQIALLEQLIRKQVAKNRQHQEGIQSLQKSLLQKSGRSNRSGRSVIRDIKEESIRKVSKH